MPFQYRLDFRTEVEYSAMKHCLDQKSVIVNEQIGSVKCSLLNVQNLHPDGSRAFVNNVTRDSPKEGGP